MDTQTGESRSVDRGEDGFELAERTRVLLPPGAVLQVHHAQPDDVVGGGQAVLERYQSFDTQRSKSSVEDPASPGAYASGSPWRHDD